MKTCNNALEIYKLLKKSNCRECGLPTCMAFAGAVYTGKKKLSDCPYLDEATLVQYGVRPVERAAIDENIDTAIGQLKEKVRQLNLQEIASQLGGHYRENRLTLQVLGKNFSVCDNGEIITDIHVNPWVVLPVYSYVIHAGSVPLSGRWVPLRELPSGKDWYRLFGQRAEKPLKNLADKFPDLFEDLIRLFNGQQVENHYASDISVVLHPLPKLPILICYWFTDGAMASDLHLFFDDTAEEYIDLNGLNSLCSGIVTMLEKLSEQHGFFKA